MAEYESHSDRRTSVYGGHSCNLLHNFSCYEPNLFTVIAVLFTLVIYCHRKLYLACTSHKLAKNILTFCLLKQVVLPRLYFCVRMDN